MEQVTTPPPEHGHGTWPHNGPFPPTSEHGHGTWSQHPPPPG